MTETNHRVHWETRHSAPETRSRNKIKSVIKWALILVASLTIQLATCHEVWLEKQRQQQQLKPLPPSTTNTNESSKTETMIQEAPMKQPSEDSMKFPLYMRILATMVCVIIFTIGVCGNLLVPLVVIKTKYLRNSTNLFLINLSIADLLVLIVCMPTVLIELHSRPETWLLGEPMCKLSNFVEMLAANGSIFTILAISFERYYAICKPLKAGYKCTRLRATIIICIIWLLSSILTSPILIMAKSSETIYIDGSLVYNCILETDTYWHKMYVFVSMFAFFCLPLLVLMLVYWLIGRRLTRENIAMSTTTSLATSDSTEITQTSSIMSFRKRVSFKKAASVKSISTFLSSLQQHNYHHFSLNQSDGNHIKSTNKVDAIVTTKTPSQNKRRKLPATKALSLDHDHHLMTNSDSIEPLNHCNVILNGDSVIASEAGSEKVRKNETSMKMSPIHRFVYQLFHLKSVANNYNKEEQLSSLTSSTLTSKPKAKAQNNGFMLHSINELNTNSRLTTENELNNDDEHLGSPFLPLNDHKNHTDNGENSPPQNRKRMLATRRRGEDSKFKWVKRFSISSAKTSYTNVPSENSMSPSQSNSVGQPTACPRPIIHKPSQSDSQKSYQADRKKCAHFNVSPTIDDSITVQVSCSSVSELSSSPYSSSPDSMFEQQSKQISGYSLGNNDGLIEKLDKPITRTDDSLLTEDVNGIGVNFDACEKVSPFIGKNCDIQVHVDNQIPIQKKGNKVSSVVINNNSENFKSELPASTKRKSLDKAHDPEHNHYNHFHFNLKRANRRSGSQPVVCSLFQSGTPLSELLVVQDLSKKQQMDSRRQVVIMLAFVVACFFLLFFPYRLFTIWLILSTEDQVQSLGMETYYNLTYFSRILIYLHSAINPIAYNLISTKFRRAFISILLCRGSSTRRHFTTEHRTINNRVTINDRKKSPRQAPRNQQTR